MTILIPGANALISKSSVSVEINYAPTAGIDIDVSAFALYANGKVRGDGDMCFYGQTIIHRSAIQIVTANTGNVTFNINLQQLDASIEKVALTATIFENKAQFSAYKQLSINISSGVSAVIDTQDKLETALILGEFYRYKNDWKFRCVAQGFVGGLESLAKHFGVEIATTPTPNPTPAKPINLNKITLDKQQSNISLEKKDGNFGEIKVNLNWNPGLRSNGFFGFGKSNGIDLDLGCLFELKNGMKGAVQALGNSFGSYRDEPYIELMADDRTGNSVDGEWLRINGSQWRDVKRILIFAFIYDGAPNWHSTDGVVTIYVPDQAPIEVKLSEEGGQMGMCAIALLENINGAVRVNREVRFFHGHEKMDSAFGWGMRWRSGSK